MAWGVAQVALAKRSPDPWRVAVVQTDANQAKRLSRMPGQRLEARRPPRGVPVIDVNDRVRYQTIKGVGGAMTDSSAYLIDDKLGPAARSRLLHSLFSSSGAGLSFLRLPMAASDFSAQGRPYSYDDLPAGRTDPQLAHFSVAHDDAYIIPMLREVRRIDPATKIIATPWSPPAWMKTNDLPSDLGHSGRLLEADEPVLAQYFVKFIQAYARRGIPIYAVTPENEPRAAAAYPSMSFPASSEASWIVQDLLPAFRAAKLSTKVYGADTSLGAPSYAEQVADADSGRGLYGIAQHCYHGTPSVFSELHAAHPRLNLILSECASELVPYSAAETVIASLRNWASVVMLWNLALDPSGGPVQAPDSGCRPCRGLVTVNPRTHAVSYGLAYYQLGQLGRFLRPGARRIRSNSLVHYQSGDGASRTFGASSGVDDVAVRDPDGRLALMTYNTSGRAIRFAVSWRGRSFVYRLPAHATATFSWSS